MLDPIRSNHPQIVELAYHIPPTPTNTSIDHPSQSSSPSLEVTGSPGIAGGAPMWQSASRAADVAGNSTSVPRSWRSERRSECLGGCGCNPNGAAANADLLLRRLMIWIVSPEMVGSAAIQSCGLSPVRVLYRSYTITICFKGKGEISDHHHPLLLVEHIDPQ